MTTKFQIPDATCGHCKATIEGAVTALPEVSAAELNLETHLLDVQHGEGVDAARLRDVITEAGYTAEPVG